MLSVCHFRPCSIVAVLRNVQRPGCGVLQPGPVPRGGAFPGPCCVFLRPSSQRRHAQGCSTYTPTLQRSTHSQQHSWLCFLLSKDARVIHRPGYPPAAALSAAPIYQRVLCNTLLQAQQLAGAGGCQQLPPSALPPPPPLPQWTCGLAVGGNFTCGGSELCLQGPGSNGPCDA